MNWFIFAKNKQTLNNLFMKKSIVAALAFLWVSTLSAQTDYSSYYRDLPKPMPVVQAPVIPDYTVYLTDFGAIGDGSALNTQAFEKAISALNKKGGGHLVVPAGIWLTGLISLKDNIAAFKGIVAGEYDHLPEQAFYMVGSIDEAVEKASKL